MSDDIGITRPLDHLLPAEKMRDSKKGPLHQEIPRKKKEHGETSASDIDQEEGEEVTGSSKDRPSGKVLDIVI